MLPLASSTTELTVTPAQVVVGQGTVTATATVSATGSTPGGDVEFYVNGVLVATDAVSGGIAEVMVGPFNTVAGRSIVAKYLGDATTTASESAAKQVTVVKATPTMTVTTSAEPCRDQGPGALHRLARRDGPGRHGQRVVRVDGRVLNGTLVNGSVVINTSKIPKAGTYPVVVRTAAARSPRPSPGPSPSSSGSSPCRTAPVL